MEYRKTHVPGFTIGTAEDREGLTGVTVILAPKEGASAGVDVRGCAPGTRETDLLSPEKTVQKIHAVVLSGGSAFGLEADSGVMNYLAKQGTGFPVGDITVPIVCGAVLLICLSAAAMPIRIYKWAIWQLPEPLIHFLWAAMAPVPVRP